MAGIGFELKKMFQKKGLFAVMKAYGYAGAVCAGPMLLGICLLLGTQVLMGAGGAAVCDRKLVNGMITYTLLASLAWTNLGALVMTRYLADICYEKKYTEILPSFWGSVSLLLVPGTALYACFLAVSGISFRDVLFCGWLFATLVVVWTEMNVLMAWKDYGGILLTFAGMLVVAFSFGTVLVMTGADSVTAAMLAVVTAYGGMAVRYYDLLQRYFPQGEKEAFHFLEWFRRYPQLPWLGVAMTFGLFGHLVIMWCAPCGVQVRGLFYEAPVYDIPAILAFLSILVTTVNFVTSVEVNVYPKYRCYFGLLGDGGSLVDLGQAQQELLVTLWQELTYTYIRQLFATVLFLIAGTFLLPRLPLGMTEDMLGIYRVLCVGYAFYAMGNCAMLMQLYFADHTGALASGVSFMAAACLGTAASAALGIRYYGAGFLFGGLVYCVTALVLLYRYLSRLMYHALCRQPFAERAHKRFFGKKNLLLAAVCCLFLAGGCGAADGQNPAGEEPQSGQETEAAGTEETEGRESEGDVSEEKRLSDKMSLYEQQDPTSVVTMYLTVMSGNASDHTDHTWTEVNSYSVYDYENMGVERYRVNGLLQAGDENGPAEGEIGYGQTVPNAVVMIRGQSSSKAEQKNYRITLQDEKGTWRDQKVINLNKHAGDLTRFSNKMCYDLMQELPDMMSLQTQFVHLYVKDLTEGGNGTFTDYGLYTQVEQLNKRALKSHGLDDHGQLYKVNFFEFDRYEDVILPRSDAGYDKAAFEQLLEIKGNDDHTKLIAMLADVNDTTIPIEEVLEKWFERENLFSWMAFHILMGNVDTQSRNVFLYSPENANTWYFLSWDNDGALTDTRRLVRNGENASAGWEEGVSNYWGNRLFARILKSAALRRELDEKIQEYRTFLCEEKLAELAEDYASVVKQYAFCFPDAEHMQLTQEAYDEMLALLPSETERNYQHYRESLGRPMPFFIGLPERQENGIWFSWENAYDFDAEDVRYTFELAEDYSFEHPIAAQEGLFTPGFRYEGTLASGQYFVRVRAENESGGVQYAFDYYNSVENGKQYGVRCFYILEDGSIGEEVYEK